MADEDRWAKLEEIVRRVVREELSGLGKKNKVELVNGKWAGITAQLKESWSTAYPGVDIEGELNKAAAWIMSNPTIAPKSQFSRFLLTWFSRTQDRLSIRSIPTRSNPEPGPGKKLCAYCESVATARVGDTWHCPSHGKEAMDGKPRAHMWGVTPKAVAGND